MVIDWNATTAWIAVLLTLAISVITPAWTNYSNNKFQLKLKKLEYDTSQNDLYLTRKYSVYDGFLQSLGNYLHYSDNANNAIVGKYIYELYLYLPKEHWELLDNIVAFVADSAYEKIPPELVKLSKILSDELNRSQSLIHTAIDQ